MIMIYLLSTIYFLLSTFKAFASSASVEQSIFLVTSNTQNQIEMQCSAMYSVSVLKQESPIYQMTLTKEIIYTCFFPCRQAKLSRRT